MHSRTVTITPCFIRESESKMVFTEMFRSWGCKFVEFNRKLVVNARTTTCGCYREVQRNIVLKWVCYSVYEHVYIYSTVIQYVANTWV